MTPYPNRPLAPGEIARNEQPRRPWKKQSPFGNTHLEACGMTMCPHCKNEDTQRVIGTFDLAPFARYYQTDRFQVHSCHSCGGLWHWLTL